jgi:G3E family GTPase
VIRFIPLGGFLGAGKTTTMLAAAKLLEAAGERVSLITNDQGADLVDTQLAKAAGIGVGEVTGGCFCCRFEDLAAVVERLAEQVNPTVVMAEAVGSCTDLQSTVVRPLRKLYGDQLQTAPLTVALDPVRHSAMATLAALPGGEPDLAYLYRHQLDEADIIAVNKADLLAPSVLDSLKDDLAERFSHARVVTYSAATGDGLAELLSVWQSAEPSTHSAFAIDYDRYAAAEAELAWTNQTFAVAGRGFVPSLWAGLLLARLSAGTAAAEATIGHVKVRVIAEGGAAKASLTAAGAEPSFDAHHHGQVTAAEITLNARVQMGTEQLAALIEESVATADAACDTVSGARTGDIFQPSYPTPVHRM